MKETTTPHRLFLVVGVLLAVTFVATACSDSSDYAYVEPATIEEVEPDLWRIELTEDAERRTGVETTEVAAQGEQLVIPYSAVMYHYDGSTWTYTNPEPLVYLREPIEIDHIDGDVAILSEGPPVGTTVVTVGAAELYGVEFGIKK